jgi:hypothetical protein
MATARQHSIPIETDAEVVKAAKRLFGSRLADAIASGSWEVASLDRPQSPRRPDLAAVRRLRDALDIGRSLLEAEAEETVRAWFAGKNPILDDRAPFAARDLLAHG